jgi:hypothetical protein
MLLCCGHGQYYPSPFFRLEGLKQAVPVAAPSKATSRFLELRVRIRPGVWMAVFCECYVLSGSAVADHSSREFVPSVCVCVCVCH